MKIRLKKSEMALLKILKIQATRMRNAYAGRVETVPNEESLQALHNLDIIETHIEGLQHVGYEAVARRRVESTKTNPDEPKWETYARQMAVALIENAYFDRGTKQVTTVDEFNNFETHLSQGEFTLFLAAAYEDAFNNQAPNGVECKDALTVVSNILTKVPDYAAKIKSLGWETPGEPAPKEEGVDPRDMALAAVVRLVDKTTFSHTYGTYYVQGFSGAFSESELFDKMVLEYMSTYNDSTADTKDMVSSPEARRMITTYSATWFNKLKFKGDFAESAAPADAS